MVVMINYSFLYLVFIIVQILSAPVVYGETTPTWLAKVNSGIVKIRGYNDLEGCSQEPCHTESSGVIWDNNGSIVSVLDPFLIEKTQRLYERYVIFFSDGSEREARLFSADRILNIAIFRTLQKKETIPLPHRNRNRVTPDMKVVAAFPTATSPNWSLKYNFGKVMRKNKKSIYGEGFADMLISAQVTIPSHGLGGPLFNESGELLGISMGNVHQSLEDVMKDDEQHALPVFTLQTYCTILTRYPTFELPWLGISLRSLTAEEKQFDYL
jgi:S1-C subfamily serine protease